MGTPQAKACATFLIRDKIHAALGEWMAARNPPQREPRTAARTVNAQRLRGVVGTGRIKFAGARHQRRKKSLIHAHQEKQRTRREAHAFGAVFRMPRNRRTSSASSGANSIRATVLFG